MRSRIKSVINAVNNFIWGFPAMILLMGVGLYRSVGTRFVQLRKFGPAMKATLGRIFKHDKAGKGALTPFQAVCTALAGTVGTGNIAGVAGAIAIGGPGAVFWMWCSALLGMCRLLYTFDAADDMQGVDLRGWRHIKKKKMIIIHQLSG